MEQCLQIVIEMMPQGDEVRVVLPRGYLQAFVTMLAQMILVALGRLLLVKAKYPNRNIL
jgi:hypothetical protein